MWVFGLLIVTTDVVSGVTERISGAGTAGQERCDDAAASGADSPHNSHARGGHSRVQPLHPHRYQVILISSDQSDQ